MHVHQLYRYPIKSLPGLSCQSVEIEETGVKYDRNWMLVDEEGQFITLRKHRSLTQFKLEEYGEGIKVYSESLGNSIQLPWNTELLDTISCTIWDDTLDCHQIRGEFDAFFSEHLQMPVHLVSMGQNQRIKKLKKQPFETNLTFVDGYPITFLSKSSLDDLNSKLDEKIDIRQFRINVILEGGQAFEEDALQHFRIRETHYSMIKEIRRCVVINMNPDSGALSKEPLRYLSKHRTIDNKVIFGMNAIVIKNGQIHVGDTVDLI